MKRWNTVQRVLRNAAPSVRALNAHIAACAGDDAESVLAARAQREERSRQSAAAHASGASLEAWLDEQHEAARTLRVADLEHLFPEVAVEQDLGDGRLLGRRRARCGADYRGVLRGGRGVTVEAKNAGRGRLALVDDGRPRFDGVKAHQAAALHRCLALGGVALLVVRFKRREGGRDVEATYAVPWDAVCALPSLGPDDVRAWPVPRDGIYLERWAER